MSHEHLADSLAALRREIDAIEVGSAEKIRLEALLNRLQLQLDDEDFNEADDQELPGLIERFENEHPNLTQALNRIMISLSDMGI